MKSIISSCLAIICIFLFGEQNLYGQCRSPLDDPSFEYQRDPSKVQRPWALEGKGGIEIDQEHAQSGDNNAYLRNKEGWNAFRQPVTLNANLTYTLRVYVRTSPNMHDGYVGFRNQYQKVMSEVKIDQQPNYRVITVNFKPRTTGLYHIFAGFWATQGDTWMKIDNVEIRFPCNDTIAIPAND